MNCVGVSSANGTVVGTSVPPAGAPGENGWRDRLADRNALLGTSRRDRREHRELPAFQDIPQWNEFACKKKACRLI